MCNHDFNKSYNTFSLNTSFITKKTCVVKNNWE